MLNYHYPQAYRHNLKVLQEFGENNFPLAKYIVDVNKDISPPSYVMRHNLYRLSSGCFEGLHSPVRILNEETWPSRHFFKFDEYQFDAFRAALTKQMVVIQGPPGKVDLTFIHSLRLDFMFVTTFQVAHNPRYCKIVVWPTSKPQ